MNDVLTCQGGEVTVGAGGEPICSGTWELRGNSAFWDLTLSTGDIAELLGVVALIFATVFCVKVLLRVIFNQR